jgi:hypothetical protein
MSHPKTSPAEGSRILAQVVPPSEIPSDVPRIYANYAQATAGQHDVVIRFGWYAIPTLDQQPAPGSTVDVPAETVAVVTIPLGMVDALITVLTAQAQVARQAIMVAEGEATAEAAKKTEAQ